MRSLLLVLPVLLVGCPNAPHEEGDGELVVGVQSDAFGSLVSSFHINAKIDGAVAHEETIDARGLPKEFELRGNPGATVEVTADAISPSGTSAPYVTRVAKAQLVTGSKKLLRLQLDARCVPPAGPACAAPLTCGGGQCVPSMVAYDALEDYEPGWAATPPDACRPAKHGPPEVILGTGQTDYATLADGQVMRLEKGPQGGHHIWIAVRMKNLRQSGSTTTITSKLLDDDAPVPPTGVIFTFEPDEGAYCKLWGIRYQVDAGAEDLANAYKRFLGKRLEVTAEVVDSTGAKAAATRLVQLADKLLCPDGTESCNVP